MPFGISYNEDIKCMICEISGKVTKKIIEEFFIDLIPLINKHKCSRILTDFREANIRLSTLDIYEIPNMSAQAGLNPTTRRAIVFSKQPAEFVFYETVSMNKGHLVKVFTNFNEALDWASI